MTRNQKIAITIMKMLKEGMNVSVQYYVSNDRIEFWYDYDEIKCEVKYIIIHKGMDDTMAHEKFDEIKSIIKKQKDQLRVEERKEHKEK